MAWAAMEERRVAAQEWCDTNKVSRITPHHFTTSPPHPQVKAFHAVTRNRSLVGGVRAAIELRGLGKLAPNMLMLGFKEDWREEVRGGEVQGGAGRGMERQGGAVRCSEVQGGAVRCTDPQVEGAGEYLVALHTALDMHLSLGLLRVQGGFNVSRVGVHLHSTLFQSTPLDFSQLHSTQGR